MKRFLILIAAAALTISVQVLSRAQGLDVNRLTEELPNRFEKDGLVFDYAKNWELSDQSNATAQQLILTEKTLDAQIMIIVLRGTISDSKQEEQAKTAVIEPSITRLLKQYEDAAIKVDRTPVAGNVAGGPAEGAQLRFAIDRQPGATDIYWRVINQRLVQLFFIRPDKTEGKAIACWDLIRNSLKIDNGKNKAKSEGGAHVQRGESISRKLNRTPKEIFSHSV